MDNRCYSLLGKYSYDWSPFFEEMDYYVDEMVAGEEYDMVDPEAVKKWGATHSLHHLPEGRMMFRNHKDNMWSFAGRPLRDQLPLTKELDKLFPDYTIAFNKLTGNLDWHVDQLKPCCGLNIFAHSHNAQTLFHIGGSYPTVKDYVYLIDNTQLHKIENVGVRRWFHARIQEPYPEALAKLKASNIFGAINV